MTLAFALAAMMLASLGQAALPARVERLVAAAEATQAGMRGVAHRLVMTTDLRGPTNAVVAVGRLEASIEYFGDYTLIDATRSVQSSDSRVGSEATDARVVRGPDYLAWADTPHGYPMATYYIARPDQTKDASTVPVLRAGRYDVDVVAMADSNGSKVPVRKMLEQCVANQRQLTVTRDEETSLTTVTARSRKDQRPLVEVVFDTARGCTIPRTVLFGQDGLPQQEVIRTFQPNGDGWFLSTLTRAHYVQGGFGQPPTRIVDLEIEATPLPNSMPNVPSPLAWLAGNRDVSIDVVDAAGVTTGRGRLVDGQLIVGAPGMLR